MKRRKGGIEKIHTIWGCLFGLPIDFGFSYNRDIPSHSTIGHKRGDFSFGQKYTQKTFRISLLALGALGMETLENALVPQHPCRRDSLAADPPRVDPFSLEFWQADDLDGGLALDRGISIDIRQVKG